jgi:glutathione reductase (NADPH)
VAETVARARHLAGEGVAGGCAVDWAELARFRRGFTDPVTARREATLRGEGVVLLRGHARFSGPNALLVGDEPVTARFIGIATGSVPRPLGIPGEALVSSSEDFLAMEALPASVLFVGGGFVSFELGFVAAVAGAEVTIVHRSGRVLKEFEPFLVDLLVEACRELGIRVKTGVPVRAVEQAGARLRVRGDGRTFEADMVVAGAGRVPNVAGLELDSGSVAVDARGIAVTPYLQSASNPSVYVAGDANPRGRPLSPVAHRDGATAAENMVTGNTVVPDYSAVPSAVYAYPVLAGVGIGEAEAARLGSPVTVHRADTRDWLASRRLGVPRSGYVVVTDGPDGRILGAHLLGHNAEEEINIFALAMRHGLSLADLHRTDWTYPTAIHEINRIH